VRIGLDARLLYYSQAGIAQYTLRLLEGLADIDSADRFVVLQSWKDKLSLARWPNFQRRSFLTPPHHRLEQILLPLELVRLRLDLLHSPDFIPPFSRSCRSVITVHDMAFMRYPKFLTGESRRYYNQIERAAESTDHIIAVSESTKRDLVDGLGVLAAKITVIPEAADPIFRPLEAGEESALSREEGRLLETPFFLFVGTIEPRKNLETVIRAFAAFRAEIGPGSKPPRLLVVGQKGWLFENVFQTVRELGLEEAVVFAGRVSQSCLVELYNRATALVMPSFYEGFGLPVVEAMACGAPVLASDVASLPEVVDEAGLLLDPKKPAQWTEAMLSIWRDESLRQSLREKGFARARQFSRPRMARQTLDVSKRVVNGAG
jgi:glycosyltransferase involved in cell wall biosynthesis